MYIVKVKGTEVDRNIPAMLGRKIQLRKQEKVPMILASSSTQ